MMKFTPDHEWVRLEGDVATIGITPFAQEKLGDLVFVELPAVGSSVKRGQAFGVVESVKAVSDIYAPASGTVTEVNERLASEPELLNRDPYGESWLIRMRLSDAAEVAELMDPAAYRAFVEKAQA